MTPLTSSTSVPSVLAFASFDGLVNTISIPEGDQGEVPNTLLGEEDEGAEEEQGGEDELGQVSHGENELAEDGGEGCEVC